MIPWQLPMKSQINKNTTISGGARMGEIPGKSLKYFGQINGIQDCIYRNMDNFEFLLVLDYDEFMVPYNTQYDRYNSTWDSRSRDDDNLYLFLKKFQTANEINRPKQGEYKHYASMLFEQQSFCGDLQYNDMTGLLRVTTNTHEKLHEGDHKKSVLNPRGFDRVNSHMVYKSLKGFEKRIAVPRNQAVKLHYRMKTNKDCANRGGRELRSPLSKRVQDELAHRIISAKNEINGQLQEKALDYFMF